MLTVTGLRRRLAAGDLTPFELLDACTERLAHTEHRVRAWVTPDPEGARRAAHALDPAARTDVAGAPLWGIPVAVKDIFDVAGLPTTASSRVLAGNVARRDAPVVTALRRGGALVLGKTNTQEFAYGVVSPPTTNPWDPARIPGGSSGGSAAAVAAGHCPAALGSDTAGSIRIPAALCGICGLKPRPGILPLDGVVPLAPSLDVAGPMAATVGDLAVLWHVLAGVPPPAPVRLTDVRIGVVPEQSLPPITPGVGAAVDAALGALGAAGGRLETAASCPGFGEFDHARTPILMWEALALHRARGWWPDRAADYTDETRTNFEYTERTGSEAGTARARAECAALSARLRAAVAAHGILVTPTAPEEAPTHDEAARLEDGSARRPVVRRLTRIPGPVNAARLAALSVPCGRGAGGLPVGLQLIGPDEPTLLAAGMAIERELGWAPTSPPGNDPTDEALD